MTLNSLSPSIRNTVDHTYDKSNIHPYYESWLLNGLHAIFHSTDLVNKTTDTLHLPPPRLVKPTMMSSTTLQSSTLPASPNSNKRKRGPNDQDSLRDMKIPHTNGQDNSADYNFLQAIQDNIHSPDGSAQTAQAALATPMAHSQYPDSFDAANQMSSFDDGGASASADPMIPTARAYMDARQQQNAQKPSVGSNAWHQQRKDNHKEVERRRREVINEGIENIAKIVPGSEKNKGAILARTCVYISELKGEIAAFETERRVFSSTLAEITNRHDAMKRECERAWAETRKWQARCRDAGLGFDDYVDGADGRDGSDSGAGVVDGFDDGDGHA